jgi:hypothetical protein
MIIEQMPPKRTEAAMWHDPEVIQGSPLLEYRYALMAHACLLGTPSPSLPTGCARAPRDGRPRYGSDDVAEVPPHPESECPGYHDLGRILGIGGQ